MRDNQDGLWPLLKPKRYQEADVQAALEAFWNCFCAEYKLTSRSEIDMPKNWQPDILAYSREDYSLLIVEVKGNPPSGKKVDAVRQVVNYADRYQSVYPDHPVRVLVIGPYRVKDHFEKVKYDGYEVGILRLQDLGQHLLKLATDTLLWQIQNPIGYKPGVGPNLVKLLKATVRQEMKDEQDCRA